MFFIAMYFLYKHFILSPNGAVSSSGQVSGLFRTCRSHSRVLLLPFSALLFTLLLFLALSGGSHSTLNAPGVSETNVLVESVQPVLNAEPIPALKQEATTKEDAPKTSNISADSPLKDEMKSTDSKKVESPEVKDLNKSSPEEPPSSPAKLADKGVSNANQDPSLPRRFAVCISGAHASALLSPSLVRGLIQHILIPNNADLFIYVSRNEKENTVSVQALQKLLSPWLQSVVVKDDVALEEEIRYLRSHQTDPGPKVLEGGFGDHMRDFLKLYKCHHTLLAPFEDARGIKYQSILQTRPDILYTNPLSMSQHSNQSMFYSSAVTQNQTLPYHIWNAQHPTSQRGVNDQVYLLGSHAMKAISSALWVLITMGPEFVRMQPFSPPNELLFLAEEKFGLGLELMKPVNFYRLVKEWNV